MNATDGTTKRRRTTAPDDTTNSAVPPKDLKPIDLAKRNLSVTLASLPVPIAQIARDVTEKLSSLHVKLDGYTKRLAKLEPSNPYIPKSIRIDTRLTCIAPVKETQLSLACSERFDTLLTETKQQMKALFLEQATIERDYFQDELKKVFSKSIWRLADAFCQHDLSVPSTRASVMTLIRCALHQEYTQFKTAATGSQPQPPSPGIVLPAPPTVDSHILMYSGHQHSLDGPSALQPILTHIAHTNNFFESSGTNIQPSPTMDDNTLVTPILSSFLSTATAVLYTFFKTYKDTVQLRDHERSVAVWAQKDITENATKETSDVLEDVNMSSPEMGELLQSHIQAGLDKLERKLDKKLEALAKNGPAAGRKVGRTKTSNGSKKKSATADGKSKKSSSSPKNKDKQSNKNGAGRKAAEADNASSANNTKRRSRRGRRKRNTSKD